MKQYNKEYYGRNKDDRKARIQGRQREIRDAIQEYKTSKGCEYCGYNKCARALQFHHLESDDKEHNIARMVGQGRALGSIMGEIAKCVVICANCHAELHAGVL